MAAARAAAVTISAAARGTVDGKAAAIAKDETASQETAGNELATASGPEMPIFRAGGKDPLKTASELDRPSHRAMGSEVMR